MESRDPRVPMKKSVGVASRPSLGMTDGVWQPCDLPKDTLSPFINPPMNILCGKDNSVVEFNWNEKQMIQLKIKTDRSFKCLLSINQFEEPLLTTSTPH